MRAIPFAWAAAAIATSLALPADLGSLLRDGAKASLEPASPGIVVPSAAELAHGFYCLEENGPEVAQILLPAVVQSYVALGEMEMMVQLGRAPE